MSRGPCTFRQQDVTRALRATAAAGIEVEHFEIGRDGKIVIFAGKSKDPAGEGKDNEWNDI